MTKQRQTLHIPYIAAEVNEHIAIEHMRKVCEGYRNKDIMTVRVHARLLRQCANECGDATIGFCADEAASVLRIMGGAADVP